jgi:hypothetical protein
MNNVLRMLFVTLTTVSCFAGSSYGGTEELMNLVQSKDFWSTYKWSRPVKESKIYKATKWILRKTDNDDQNYYYDTDIILNSNKTQMTISVNKRSNMISDYQVTLGDANYNDYDELLRWCEREYGKADVYNENKTGPGDGIFKAYIKRKSFWITGGSVINLVLSADVTLKPLVVDLIFSNKKTMKIDRPSTTVICKNMTMTSTSNQPVQTKKMNDVIMILDENLGKVFDANLDPAGLSFTVTEKLFKIERKNEIGSLVYFIDRLTGKLEGEIISYDIHSIVSGECERIEPATRKF